MTRWVICLLLVSGMLSTVHAGVNEPEKTETKDVAPSDHSLNVATFTQVGRLDLVLPENSAAAETVTKKWVVHIALKPSEKLPPGISLEVFLLGKDEAFEDDEGQGRLGSVGLFHDPEATGRVSRFLLPVPSEDNHEQGRQRLRIAKILSQGGTVFVRLLVAPIDEKRLSREGSLSVKILTAELLRTDQIK